MACDYFKTPLAATAQLPCLLPAKLHDCTEQLQLHCCLQTALFQPAPWHRCTYCLYSSCCNRCTSCNLPLVDCDSAPTCLCTPTQLPPNYTAPLQLPAVALLFNYHLHCTSAATCLCTPALHLPSRLQAPANTLCAGTNRQQLHNSGLHRCSSYSYCYCCCY